MTIKDAVNAGISEYEAHRLAFESARSLDEALKIAWGYSDDNCFYQHYTTLDSVLTKISKGQWWMTRSVAESLNDLQEVKKFGSQRVARKTYQASFIRGVDESTAMWGLYCRDNPFAVRILMPAKAFSEWQWCIKKEYGDAVNCVDFRDIIYASVPYIQKDRDAYDKARGNSITWRDANCNFRRGKIEQDALARKLLDPRLTGWIKDREWRHERETRLCVRFVKSCQKDAIPVSIPVSVINQMSFTASPWLCTEHEKIVKRMLECALDLNWKRLRTQDSKAKRKVGWFHRSVLAGALNFKKEIGAKCPNPKRCVFSVMTAKGVRDR